MSNAPEISQALHEAARLGRITEVRIIARDYARMTMNPYFIFDEYIERSHSELPPEARRLFNGVPVRFVEDESREGITIVPHDYIDTTRDIVGFTAPEEVRMSERQEAKIAELEARLDAVITERDEWQQGAECLEVELEKYRRANSAEHGKIRTVGPARLCERMLEDTPRSVVAIWKGANGKWYRSWWFDGEETCSEVLGQLQLAGLRIYDESMSYGDDDEDGHEK